MKRAGAADATIARRTGTRKIASRRSIRLRPEVLDCFCVAVLTEIRSDGRLESYGYATSFGGVRALREVMAVSQNRQCLPGYGQPRDGNRVNGAKEAGAARK